MLSAQSTDTESVLHTPHFFLFLHAAATFPLPQADVLHWRGEGGSSVRRSSHHLWNFRARPRWKGVLCPPDEECPRVARQRKGLIWPGIWRDLERCREIFSEVGIGTWMFSRGWTGEGQILTWVSVTVTDQNSYNINKQEHCKLVFLRKWSVTLDRFFCIIKTRLALITSHCFV